MPSGVPGQAAVGSSGAAVPPQREWLGYGDAMRVLGVYAVLLVHVCDMVMFDKTAGARDWWVANIVDAAGRWAVPVFIMLSGALLLNPSRQETSGQFYRRRLARLGVPIVFWSVCFMLFAVYYTHWRSATWDLSEQSKSIWKDLLKGAPYMHLHFVFRLAGLYAITPMLRVYVRHAPWDLRAKMVVLLLALGVGNWAITSFLNYETTAFSSLWPFLGFYLAGDVLRGVRMSRRLLHWSCAGFVVSWVGMVVGTGFLVPAPGAGMKAFPAIDTMLYDFLSPFRILMSVSAWLILAYVFGRIPRQARLQRVLAYLAPLTLGIYLVHPLFREVMYVEGWHFNQPSVWVGIPLATLALVAASTIFTWLIRCVPLLRRIVG